MSFKDGVTHKTGGKHEFRAAQMDSLLYFYRQEYRTIFSATKCRHATPRICFHSWNIIHGWLGNREQWTWMVWSDLATLINLEMALRSTADNTDAVALWPVWRIRMRGAAFRCGKKLAVFLAIKTEKWIYINGAKLCLLPLCVCVCARYFCLWRTWHQIIPNSVFTSFVHEQLLTV